MKNNIFPVLLGSLMMLAVLSACTDERTRPEKPVEPSYNETIMLLDRAVSNGNEVSMSFNLRDDLADGKLFVFCFIKADADMNQMDDLTERIDLLTTEIDQISAEIFDRWAAGELTESDSLALIQEQQDKHTEIANIHMDIDVLDTWLDDRFKLSVRLDDDASPLYPYAVRLDSSSAVGDNGSLDYLMDSTIVWGQGNYRALEDNEGWHGRRVEIDLNEFWVADPSWEHPRKPLRTEFLLEPPTYPDRYSAYELMPIRTWLERLTPVTAHEVHLTLGSDNTQTEISASLYLVYNEKE